MYVVRTMWTVWREPGLQRGGYIRSEQIKPADSMT